MTFHIKGGGKGTSFSRYWHLKFMPEKFIFHSIMSVSKHYMTYCSPNSTCTFLHNYEASFSIKLILCETNIFYSRQYPVWDKEDNRFWKFIENKGDVLLATSNLMALKRPVFLLRANNCNFIRNLPKVSKWHFLESVLECLKMCQEPISHHNAVGKKWV